MKFLSLKSKLQRGSWLVAGTAALLATTMIPAGPAQANAPINLGNLDFWGMAVYDVSDVTDQLTQAAGYNFSSPSTATYEQVKLEGNQGHQDITLETQWSKDDGPFVQVVHANANVGPWVASTTKSTQFAGYGVKNVRKVEKQLKDAGMTLIARAQHGEFAFYRGINDNVIELLREDLVPTAQPNGAPPAGVYYLGDSFAHFDYSPCGQIDAMAAQLEVALGTTFDYAPAFDPNPFNFYDSNNQLTDVQSYAIQIRDQHGSEPRVDLDQGLPVTGTAKAPFTCDSIHIAFSMRTSLDPNDPPQPGEGSTEELDAQMLAAGMNRFCDVTFLGPRVLSFYVGKGGIVLETTDALVDIL